MAPFFVIKSDRINLPKKLCKKATKVYRYRVMLSFNIVLKQLPLNCTQKGNLFKADMEVTLLCSRESLRFNVVFSTEADGL
jgi:hypothetical protein